MSGGAFWKLAGLNYLQYLSISSRAVRAALKVIRNSEYNNYMFVHLGFEVVAIVIFAGTHINNYGVSFVMQCVFVLDDDQEPAKSKALAREAFFFNKTVGKEKSK